MTVEARFRAMGSACHVVITHGSAADIRWAESEVRRLEALWTRFDAASEVSRANRSAGSPVAVSAETRLLARRARRAQAMTGGRFDPLMGVEIVALGYDRDHGLLALPPFLLAAQSRLAPGDVGAGPTLTAYFLEAFIFNPMNRPLPPARLWLLDRLTEAGRL